MTVKHAIDVEANDVLNAKDTKIQVLDFIAEKDRTSPCGNSR